MNIKLKGKLEFISLWKPIKLFTENNEIDLRKHLFDLFDKLNGVKSNMDIEMNSIIICADENSEHVIEYENDKDGILILLKEADGSFGMSNVEAYLCEILQRLNGRSINVSIGENGIEITNNPDEEVFGLYYTKNNRCKIPDDKINTVCKIGTSDCCIFTTVGSDGFECLKFDSPSARHLLDRHSKKEMNASRIGNCAILGRNEIVLNN